MKAKFAISVFITLILSAFVVNASAQSYPDKPITLVLGFPAGGGSTGITRLIAAKMQKELGVPVVVLNKPGANGSIAAGQLAKAAPDGYTLLMMASTHIINSFTYKDLPYDVVDDFTPVASLVTSPFILTANADFPVESVADLIAMAKEKPGTITYGSAGIGSMNHLFQVSMDDKVNIDLVHVPYQGGGPSLTDLLGGRISLLMQSMAQGLPLIKTNKVKALAVTSARRSEALPNIPTLAESGVPDYEGEIWYGILAPAGLPDAIKKTLEIVLKIVLQDSEINKYLAQNATRTLSGSAVEMKRMMLEERDKWKPLFEKGVIN